MTTMTPETFLHDISRELANRAHAGTSFSPEKRGEAEINDYAATLAADYENLAREADTPEKLVLLQTEFARYRDGYSKRYTAYLASRSRCLSTMITGPSNFPTRRNVKRNAVTHRRVTDLSEFRARALSAITEALHPERRPIMSGDADAVSRLTEKIVEAEALQVHMRAVNSAIRRHAKAGKDAQVTAILEVAPDLGAARAALMLQPDCLGRIGYADFELSNNNANIRRMKARLELLSRDKASAPLSIRGDGVLCEDCPADNRVRLFFTGIPAVAIRTRLKACGFRWTPSLKCWQAYRNTRSLAQAEKFVVPANGSQARVAAIR
jgi:hypothetical protein